MARVFGARRFGYYGDDDSSGLSFIETFRFLTGTCKALRGFLHNERFFTSVRVRPGMLQIAVSIAPGIRGCRRLMYLANKGIPQSLSKEFASLNLPNLQELFLQGDKLTKAFWSKKVLASPLWKNLTSFGMNASYK